uniref:RZZ complex subunit KNTC1/ROD C-terminal domain-containing protein n=1 Tax=Pygocentrus nattereri TaxID=42514 RepID=A0AAR2K3S5_PYGNA
MWNNVELLINEDTNTVRLSSDSEHGSALYQVDTLVRISPSEKVPSNPRIYASNNQNCCLVVADATVVLFDPSFQTVLAHLYFDTSVDAVSVCPQGHFLFVAERNGNLHIIYVPLKKTILTKGTLSLWDSHSLVMLCCWPDLYILDFMLLSEGDSPHLQKLLVQSLPTMDVLYCLEVSAVSSLVQKTISMDVIYLLEGITDNSKRLNRLLYKHKFEEAEKFALAFELDVELVYKVKLDFVLEKLASVAIKAQDQDVWAGLVEEAKINLMKIMDEQYVVQYCLNAFWPTLSTAEEMLNYAANRFPSSQIQSALAKLATFCNLYGSDNFNGVSWIEFLNSTDYLKIILRFLREGNLSRAQYLWLRHECEFASKFDERSLNALLNSISPDIPSQDLSIWLKGVVVPFMWKVLPKGQVFWLKNCWPQNGLVLAELGLPSFWMSINLTEDYRTEEVEHLKVLVTNLRQLCDLYAKYNCRLSLSDFEMGSTRSMAFLMLDKVLAPELIPGVIESSVRPYALEHRLDLDQILLDYIKDLLDCCSSQITSLFTEWEAKAVAVLHCMTDTNVRVVHTSHIQNIVLHCPLGGSGLRLTFEHRSRVLLCLIRIADSATLEALSHTPKDKVKYYLKCYVYLSQLETLNIPYNLEMFLISPKEGMIKGLWKNHSNEPQAVRLVADLCLEYEVFDLQLWSGILQKLLVFNMVCKQDYFFHSFIVPSFFRTWRSVILRFAQFSLMAYSLGTLLLIPCSKKREKQIQSFLLSCNPAVILDQLEESMNTGELAGIPSQIRDAVLTFLFQSGHYQTLMKTEHFQALMKHFVLKGLSEQVNELVKYLVNHNRLVVFKYSISHIPVLFWAAKS